MFVHHRRLHNITQIVLDAACLPFIWYSTIQVRLLLNPMTHAHVAAQAPLSWAPSLGLVLPVWLASSFCLRLYRRPDVLQFWTICSWAFENSLLLTTATAVVTFFSREFGDSVSRMFVPAMFPVAVVLLAMARYAGIGLVAWSCEYIGRPLRIALLGDSQRVANVIDRIQQAQAAVIRGLILPEGALASVAACSVPVLGTTQQLAELVNRERLEHVIVFPTSIPSLELEQCTHLLERMGVTQSCAIEGASGPARLDLTTLYGLPFVEVVPRQFTRGQELVKRIFDVTVSAAVLVVLAPLLLVIMIQIKLTSDGPVLYKSRRVGKGGRHFTFLKFRSMYVNNDRRSLQGANEKGGHIFKMRNDPRVTPIGRLLRRYSLDEMPQLVNVLRGEMSLVGPRPLPAGDLGPDGMSKTYAVWSEGRSQVMPGLTGLWQISGRSDLPFEDMVRLDLSYIQNWSLALDIRILLNTPLLVLRGVGAY